MKMTTLKMMGVMVLGLGALTARLGAAEPADQAQANEPRAAAKEAEKRLVRIRIPSQRDGIVLVIGTELRKDEKVPADQIVTAKVGGEERKYRRLKVGDQVEEGQLVAQLDDRLARHDVAISQARVRIAEAELRGSQALREVYQSEIDRFDHIIRSTGKREAVSAGEYAIARSQLAKTTEEVASKKGAVELARLELQKSQTVLDMYQVRSPVRGVIKSITRHPGEAARQWQTVLQVEAGPARK